MHKGSTLDPADIKPIAVMRHNDVRIRQDFVNLLNNVAIVTRVCLEPLAIIQQGHRMNLLLSQRFPARADDIPLSQDVLVRNPLFSERKLRDDVRSRFDVEQDDLRAGLGLAPRHTTTTVQRGPTGAHSCLRRSIPLQCKCV